MNFVDPYNAPDVIEVFVYGDFFVSNALFYK